MKRRILLVGVLALTTAAGLGTPAVSEESRRDDAASLGSFLGVMGALKDFSTRVCQEEPQAAFDLLEIARRALGRHAPDHRDRELGEFGQLVARRLLRWYSGTLQRERVGLLRESWPDPIFGTGTAIGSWASITAITPITAIPSPRRTFVYHLRWADGTWRVYDIELNSRSRIRAYYTEFDRIILNEGYPALLRRLKAEVARDDGARNTFAGEQRALDEAARTACNGAAGKACDEATSKAADHSRGCRNAS